MLVSEDFLFCQKFCNQGTLYLHRALRAEFLATEAGNASLFIDHGDPALDRLSDENGNRARPLALGNEKLVDASLTLEKLTNGVSADHGTAFMLAVDALLLPFLAHRGGRGSLTALGAVLLAALAIFVISAISVFLSLPGGI